MQNFIIAEAIKLRRSLVLLLAGAAPTFVAVMVFLISWRTKGDVSYMSVTMNGAGLWAVAMLPLSITAVGLLMAQVEHGPKSWDHILTMPGARPRLYAAKALVMTAVVLAMSMLLWLMIGLAASFVAVARPVDGTYYPTFLAALLAKMSAASLLTIILQLWISLRFRSFVPPLVVGIVGTFIAVAASGAREGIIFPWLMPLHVLASEPLAARTAIILGSLGGLLGAGLMIFDLSRRET